MEGSDADEAVAANGGEMAVEEAATTTAGAADEAAPAIDETQATLTVSAPPPQLPPPPRAAVTLIPGSRVSDAGPPPCSPTARVADEQELRAWIESGSRELTPGVWGVLAETAATGFVR